MCRGTTILLTILYWSHIYVTGCLQLQDVFDSRTTYPGVSYQLLVGKSYFEQRGSGSEPSFELLVLDILLDLSQGIIEIGSQYDPRPNSDGNHLGDGSHGETTRIISTDDTLWFLGDGAGIQLVDTGWSRHRSLAFDQKTDVWTLYSISIENRCKRSGGSINLKFLAREEVSNGIELSLSIIVSVNIN